MKSQCNLQTTPQQPSRSAVIGNIFLINHCNCLKNLISASSQQLKFDWTSFDQFVTIKWPISTIIFGANTPFYPSHTEHYWPYILQQATIMHASYLPSVKYLHIWSHTLVAAKLHCNEPKLLRFATCLQHTVYGGLSARQTTAPAMCWLAIHQCYTIIITTIAPIPSTKLWSSSLINMLPFITCCYRSVHRVKLLSARIVSKNLPWLLIDFVCLHVDDGWKTKRGGGVRPSLWPSMSNTLRW